MSLYIDRKYLLLISSKLRNFKDKGNDVFNFSCPICGDSSTNKLKARGYFYPKGDKLIYSCHNCSISTGFSKFLKELDITKYKEYLLERFGDTKKVELTEERAKKNATKPALFGTSPKEKFTRKLTIDLPSIKSLPINHSARQYIASRMIPDEFWGEIYYAEDFKKFMDSFFPEHNKDLIEEDPRIVVFFTNRSGDITNVSGRSISKNPNILRYVNIKITEDKKVFGLHRVNLKKTLYIVEGQFDSMFLPNCVAAGDSGLLGVAEHVRPLVDDKSQIVIVFDNEDRNTHNIKQMAKSLNRHFKIALFPKNIIYKDINEMVEIGGMAPEEILNIIEDNTISGLEGLLKLSEWRKI